MLIKLLAGVLAAVSITVVGFYLATDPALPTAISDDSSASACGSAPPCCASMSRTACSLSADVCHGKSVAAEPLAACVGGFAIATTAESPTADVIAAE